MCNKYAHAAAHLRYRRGAAVSSTGCKRRRQIRLLRRCRCYLRDSVGSAGPDDVEDPDQAGRFIEPERDEPGPVTERRLTERRVVPRGHQDGIPWFIDE